MTDLKRLEEIERKFKAAKSEWSTLNESWHGDRLIGLFCSEESLEEKQWLITRLRAALTPLPVALRGEIDPEPGPREGTILIPLTQGKHAVIDRADFDLIKDRTWYARRDRTGKWYARTGHHPEIMHVIIMGRKGIDHKDGDGLNNSRSNLRDATNSQNQMNKSIGKRNTSGFKGVYFHSRERKWKAKLMLHKKMHNLGTFDSAEEAAHAYDAGAIKIFGEFAKLNFPLEAK